MWSSTVLRLGKLLELLNDMAVRIMEENDGMMSEDVRYFIARRYPAGKRLARPASGLLGRRVAMERQPFMTSSLWRQPAEAACVERPHQEKEPNRRFEQRLPDASLCYATNLMCAGDGGTPSLWFL